MAFNPFHYFRKHQKAIFAVVTIVIMFVFILQFGRGDAFERMLGFVGAGKNRGPVVVTLNGTKVRELELEKIARLRKAANDFIFVTVWDAHPRVLTDMLAKDLKSESKDNPMLSLRLLAMSANRRSGMQLLFSGMRPEETLQQIQEDLRRLEEMAAQKPFREDTDRIALLKKLGTILGFQSWLLQHPRAMGAYLYGRSLPDDLYFGGGVKTVDERLDFVLWKQQADRLSIHLTDPDVAREVIHEAAGYEVFDLEKGSLDKEKKIVDFVQNRRDANLTAKDLIEALRDEFRVVMAQGALVGYEPGVRSFRAQLGATTSPAVVTPDEFLNFFREHRTRLTVKMLAVPAEKFLDQVKETPTERELRARYELFKEKEPAPASRDPGFKEPRRIVVEYVSASPQDPFYREQTRKQAEVLRRSMDPRFRAWAAFGAGFLTPMGAGPLGPVLVKTSPLVFDPVRASYQNSLLATRQMDPRFGPTADELAEVDYQARADLARVARPTGITSLVGTLARPSNGFTALAGLYAGMVHDDLFGSLPPRPGEKKRPELGGSLRQALSVVPALAEPQNLLAALTLAMAGPADRGTYRKEKRWALKPEVLSEQEMTPVLLAALEDRLASGLLKGNLETLRTELVKLRTDPKKAEEYLARAVKEFHLKRNQMPEPLSQHALTEALEHKADVGINELKEAFLQREPGQRVRDFVAVMFDGQGVYEPRLLEGALPRQREFMYWRREDLPARVRPFEAVRADVVRAWKLERARQLARQKAEELEKKINASRWSPADAERFLREQQAGLGALFELDNVSQFVQPREVHLMLRGGYQFYQVPEDKTSLLRYPPPDMVKQFLTLERGEATVITDVPAQTYYVAVLMARDEPSVKEFSEVYGRSPRFDTMYLICRRERMEEYRRTVLEQLRREATGNKLDREGRYPVPDEIRKRESGRGSEVEE
jgi:hypothetical protein